MKRFTCSVAMLMALIALLLVASCLPVGLGDPEKARVQEQYVGNWTWQTADTRHLVMLQPWDARTFALRLITISRRPGEKVLEDAVLKAWLTEIEGQALITLEALPAISGDTTRDGKRFLVLKLNLVDEQLIATSINPSFPPFESLTSSEELERLISKHLNDPAAWVEEAISTRRASAQEVKEILSQAQRAIADNIPAN